MDYQGNLKKINTDFSNIAVLINDTTKSVLDQYKEFYQIANIRKIHEDLRRILNSQTGFAYSLEQLTELQENIKEGSFSSKLQDYKNILYKTFETEKKVSYCLGTDQVSKQYIYSETFRNNLSSVANNRNHLSKPVFGKSKIQFNIYYFIEIANEELKKIRENDNGNLKKIFEYIYGAIELFIFNLNDDIRYYEGKDRNFTESLRSFFCSWFSYWSRSRNTYGSTARELSNIKNFFVEPMKNSPLFYINSFENIPIIQRELMAEISTFKNIQINEHNVGRCRGIIRNIDGKLVDLYRLLLINKE